MKNILQYKWVGILIVSLALVSGAKGDGLITFEQTEKGVLVTGSGSFSTSGESIRRHSFGCSSELGAACVRCGGGLIPQVAILYNGGRWLIQPFHNNTFRVERASGTFGISWGDLYCTLPDPVLVYSATGIASDLFGDSTDVYSKVDGPGSWSGHFTILNATLENIGADKFGDSTKAWTSRVGDVFFKTVSNGVSLKPLPTAVSPISKDVPYKSADYHFSVTSGMSWTWSKDVDWITISEPKQQSGDHRFDYSVEENTSGHLRTGTITITSDCLLACLCCSFGK